MMNNNNLFLDILAIVWLIIFRVISTLSICHKTLNSQENQSIDAQDPGVTHTSSVYITRCSFINNLSSYTF